VEWGLRRLAARGPTALDPSKAVERTHAVAATIEASMGLLSAADREHCLDLAIFPEDVPIPLSVLALLWPGDVELISEELVGIGLVADYRLDPPGPRLLLHDVIREYLRTCRLDDSSVHARLVYGAQRLAGDNWWELPEDADYLWRFAPYHADKAGLPVDWVCDLRWVEAKTRNLGSPVGALADLHLDRSSTATALRWALEPVARLVRPHRARPGARRHAGEPGARCGGP
jgi:hypothetical protein